MSTSLAPLKLCYSAKLKRSPSVRRVKRQLKVPGSNLTEEEMELATTCTIAILGCGYSEIDGEYTYCGMKEGSGMYSRYGPYTNEHGVVTDRVKFIIYKAKCEPILCNGL